MQDVLIGFTATCSCGHDPVVFTDPDQLKAHIKQNRCRVGEVSHHSHGSAFKSLLTPKLGRPSPGPVKLSEVERALLGRTLRHPQRGDGYITSLAPGNGVWALFDNGEFVRFDLKEAKGLLSDDA